VSPSFTLGARGYLGGGDTARGVVVAHHSDALSTSLLYCSPKLFPRSTESEKGAKFWGIVHWVFPGGRAPLRRRDKQLICRYL
jgi:hypothetical protein